jgi:Ser/Thr protein kinase RdoA (MazF antagonist)
LANLLQHGAETYVIDFDDCGWGWFLYDFGAAVSFFEHDPRVPELTDAWVRGYRTVRPMSAADEAEIPTFVLMRRLLLVAWIGSHSGHRAGALDGRAVHGRELRSRGGLPFSLRLTCRQP